MEVEIRVGSEFLMQFKRLSKKYRSLKSDIKDLKDSLVINPFQGTSLGKGVRKVRMAIASKGKSGGARVITYNLYQEGDSIIIDLLTIYDKGEISNISDEFISFLLDKRENG
jgi:mRNA-degrading endonuclease RelE of RelBE toxin-antitoxin system